MWHLSGLLVPGLREAKRTGNARAEVASRRLVSTRDPLTGLLNGPAFAAVGRSTLAWATRHLESVSLIVIALEPGTSCAAPAQRDGALAALAKLSASVLDEEDLAARTGAGELTLLLANGDEARLDAITASLGGLLAGSNAEATGHPLVVRVASSTVHPEHHEVDFADVLSAVRASLSTGELLGEWPVGERPALPSGPPATRPHHPRVFVAVGSTVAARVERNRFRRAV